MKPSRLPVLLIGVLGLWAASGSAMVVSIDRPTFLEPALGEVEVEVSIESQATVSRVALFVDGRALAILETPPYRWIANVGDENSTHEFRVVATDVLGATAEATVSTPPLQADDQVDLLLQQLYVTVFREGRAAEVLTRAQFSVEDRSEAQDLVTFERGDIPLTAVVLQDVSSSMGGAELDIALSSSKSFIEGLQPLDRTMLLLFSDRVIRSTEFTGFKEVLAASLSDVKATGPTALHDHLYLGLKLLERQQGSSVLTAEDVSSFAGRSQALVYWLRLPAPGLKISSAWRDAEGYREDLDRLEDLVTNSGGRILELANVGEAGSAFAEVLAELRNQYVLGYYPTTRSDDGSWHPVRVRVSGAGLKVRTRRGYIDF